MKLNVFDDNKDVVYAVVVVYSKKNKTEESKTYGNYLIWHC